MFHLDDLGKPSLHTCYVEAWPGPICYQRLFHKVPTPVEVCNDQGATATLFRELRAHPQSLLSGGPSTERLHCHHLLTSWYMSQQVDRPTFPSSVEELRAQLLAPYQRLRTVLFEALPWRDCLERYNDPRALLMLEPPWDENGRDEWAALQLRLVRARFQWRLILSRHIWTQRRFPYALFRTEREDMVYLAPHHERHCLHERATQVHDLSGFLFLFRSK